MYRKPMKLARDRKVFRHTAQQMNAVNVYDVIPRGGTRL